MNGKIRVVVDSSADFPLPSVVERYNLTVVPGAIRFGAEEYLDGREMDAEAFFQKLSDDKAPQPEVLPPTIEQYTEVFTRLSRETDKIISLHASRTLGLSWENAKAAAQTLLGRCDIQVVDSMTTSAGLGMLAEFAAKSAEKNTSLDDVVRVLRGAIGRTYSIFCVDTLETIQRRHLLGEAQAILGTMLGIKPFLTIEDGHLITMEKVRTRSQVVDKLVEFALEFSVIERLVIVQNSPFLTETVRLLQDRLASELSQRNFPTILYGPFLASFLGPDATGIIVLEQNQ